LHVATQFLIPALWFRIVLPIHAVISITSFQFFTCQLCN